MADGADDLAVGRLVPARALEVGGQPEIEQDDPALERDQDVRRLDVAVQLARLVQRTHSLGKLQERDSQPGLVEQPAARFVPAVVFAGAARASAPVAGSAADRT